MPADAEREPQQLQNYWSEVRYMVRCIYRQAGTPLADDQDHSLVPDKEGVKELVDRYTSSPCLVPPSLPSARRALLSGSGDARLARSRRPSIAGPAFWFRSGLLPV